MRPRGHGVLAPELHQRTIFLWGHLALLKEGRREDVPVLVFMGRFGGEGKSFWLGPLRPLFGIENVQPTRQPGNFPLMGLERKRVALVDDGCFDVLPLPTQLLWYEGKPFPLVHRIAPTTMATYCTAALCLSS